MKITIFNHIFDFILEFAMSHWLGHILKWLGQTMIIDIDNFVYI